MMRNEVFKRRAHLGKLFQVISNIMLFKMVTALEAKE